MDFDTIFPALSSGENIVGKYQHSECCNSVETIAILTNARLLIRWKETFWCFFHQSLYSAIELNSILRIDERRPSIRAFYIWLLTTIISFISMISGFASKNVSVGLFALIVLLCDLVYVLFYYLNLKNKYVSLSGTFGWTITLKFEKGQARDLEAKLSEMMHQTKPQHLNQQAAFIGLPSTSEFPV